MLGAEHQRDEITVPISASTTINSGYAELQSSFGDALLRHGERALRRQRPLRQQGHLPRGAGLSHPGHAERSSRPASAPASRRRRLSQMFQNFPDFDFFANPNLKPETSVGCDVGFEQALASDAVRFGVTYFRNNIKNLIDDNADFTSLANIGRAVTDGVESFVVVSADPVADARAWTTPTPQAIDEIRQRGTAAPAEAQGEPERGMAGDEPSVVERDAAVGQFLDRRQSGFLDSAADRAGLHDRGSAASYDLAGHWALLRPHQQSVQSALPEPGRIPAAERWGRSPESGRSSECSGTLADQTARR